MTCKEEAQSINLCNNKFYFYEIFFQKNDVQQKDFL